jgi:hypothetical protein
MRIPAILVCAALSCSGARSEPLSAADREALLEKLEKLRESADAKVDARFRTALAAYRNAVGSDDEAISLYLKCTEKVNFEDQQKKPSEFREWKRKEDERLSDPALRDALRIQLRWLILTLQAASEKANRNDLASSALDIVDSVFSDPKKLRSQTGLLGEDVTATVFARAYEIGNLKLEKWPLSPTSLAQIYDEVLLPPLRHPDRVGQLRSAWIKRIQQEGAMREFWSPAPKETRRIGMAEDQRPPEYDQFLADTVPQLQWQMELDLFRAGDEGEAAMRMLAHLEKHINHKSAREWGEEFGALLRPKAAAPAPPDGEEPPPGT